MGQVLRDAIDIHYLTTPATSMVRETLSAMDSTKPRKSKDCFGETAGAEKPMLRSLSALENGSGNAR